MIRLLVYADRRNVEERIMAYPAPAEFVVIMDLNHFER